MAQLPLEEHRSTRPLFSAGLVGICLAIALVACGFQALLKLDLYWQPDGSSARLRCDDAGVSTVIVSLYENGANSEPTSQVTLPCNAWSGDQTLLVAPGTQPVRVQGLNAEGAICYEDLRSVTFSKREDHLVEWTVVEAPNGRTDGCAYP